MRKTILILIVLMFSAMSFGDEPTTKPVERIFVGIGVVDFKDPKAPSIIGDDAPVPKTPGVVVSRVFSRSPADAEDIKPGNILIFNSLGGSPATRAVEFIDYVHSFKPGDLIDFQVKSLQTNDVGKKVWTTRNVSILSTSREKFVDSFLLKIFQKHNGDFLQINYVVEKEPVFSVNRIIKSQNAKVIQIIDKNSMIVEYLKNGESGIESYDVYLSETDTEGMIDDKWYKMEDMAIIGTKTYATVIGGSRTVFNLVPLKKIEKVSNSDLPGLRTVMPDDLKKFLSE